MPGKSVQVFAVPPVQVAAYAAGNAIGGVFEIPLAFDSEFSGVLQDVDLRFKSAQTATFTLLLFKGVNAAHGLTTTIADKATPAWDTADLAKLIEAVTLGTPASLVGGTRYVSDLIGRPRVGGFTSLWGVLTANAGVTPGSVSDLWVGLGMLKD